MKWAGKMKFTVFKKEYYLFFKPDDEEGQNERTRAHLGKMEFFFKKLF